MWSIRRATVVWLTPSTREAARVEPPFAAATKYRMSSQSKVIEEKSLRKGSAARGRRREGEPEPTLRSGEKLRVGQGAPPADRRAGQTEPADHQGPGGRLGHGARVDPERAAVDGK